MEYHILQGFKEFCYTDPAWLSLTNERKFVDSQQQINER